MLKPNLREYKDLKREKSVQQNKLFKFNAKTFYREMGKEKITFEDATTMEEAENSWKNIWSDERI